MRHDTHDILALMREFRVRRFKDGGLEIELHESAFAPAPGAAATPEDARRLLDDGKTLCACGCDLLTEHNALGCLNGCSVALCNTRADRAPKE